jgi:hypothetical protein
MIEAKNVLFTVFQTMIFLYYIKGKTQFDRAFERLKKKSSNIQTLKKLI